MSVSEAIPGASRLRNQNEILIEKSDEAILKTKSRNSLVGIFCCNFCYNLKPFDALSF